MEESASVSVSGDFTVGKGIDSVAMSVQKSGSLIVSSNGQFAVTVATFDIGICASTITYNTVISGSSRPMGSPFLLPSKGG